MTEVELAAGLAGILVVALVAAFAVVWGRDGRLKRRIRDVKPTTVAAATPGAPARLSGVIVARGDTLRAPITGRACVYYEARLLVFQPGGRHGKLVDVANEKHWTDFAVRDATGVMWVHMPLAEVAVVRDHNTRSGQFDDPTEIEAAFLARHRQSATKESGRNHSYTYIEGALEVGEEIGLLGTVQEIGGERALMSAPGAPLVVSDDPITLARA
jgi:hypothetical protein